MSCSPRGRTGARRPLRFRPASLEDVLASTEPLTHLPRRVLVAGVSGVGKSTLCRRIAQLTGHPYTEIDELFHGPDWTPRTTFDDDVGALSARDSWVTEWQYDQARPLLAARADTLVWLDLPAGIALSRVIRRTVRRSRTREVLWNGNTEPGLWFALTSRDGVIQWAIRTRRKYNALVPAAEAANPHLQVIRLESQGQVESWLRGPLADSLLPFGIAKGADS